MESYFKLLDSQFLLAPGFGNLPGEGVDPCLLFWGMW